MAHLHLIYYTPPGPSTMLDGEVEIGDLCPLAITSTSLNCSEIGLDLKQLSTSYMPTYFSIASCSLSCMGSLLIFLAYFTLKGIRNVAQKIITLLALADFFTALGYLLADWNFLTNSQDSKDCSVFNGVCKVQSFVTSVSSICSFGWTCALALHFYLLLSLKRKKRCISSLLVWQNVVLWIFPLLIILPLLITDKLGFSTYAASSWCFIKGQDGSVEEIALILIGGKLWEILSYLLVVVLYTLTTLKFNKQVGNMLESSTL